MIRLLELRLSPCHAHVVVASAYDGSRARLPRGRLDQSKAPSLLKPGHPTGVRETQSLAGYAQAFPACACVPLCLQRVRARARERNAETGARAPDAPLCTCLFKTSLPSARLCRWTRSQASFHAALVCEASPLRLQASARLCGRLHDLKCNFAMCTSRSAPRRVCRSRVSLDGRGWKAREALVGVIRGMVFWPFSEEWRSKDDWGISG